MVYLFRRASVLLIFGTLVACQSARPESRSAESYIRTDCSGPGSIAESTHRECRIQTTYGWADGNGNPQTRVLTLAPGERSTVTVVGCAEIRGARFVDSNCK